MKFINNSPLGDLDVPALGRIVEAGEEFDVPVDLAPAFAAQEFFPAVDEEAEAAQTAALDDLAAINAQLNPVTERQAPPPPPAGNASTEAWATWAVDTGLATLDEVAGLGRDQLRQKYAPETLTPTEQPADVDGNEDEQGPVEDDPANADVTDETDVDEDIVDEDIETEENPA